MKHCWLTQFLKASTEAATILICYLISLANIFVMLSESSQIGHLIPCSEGEVIELSKRPSYNCLIHFYPRGVCQVSCIVYSCLYSGLKRKLPMSCSLRRLILIIVYYYFVQYKYSLYYLQVCYLKATKLEKPDWCQEMQVSFCLNDQAYIAWFTSTRGKYQVGFLAFKLYSGLMRVHYKQIRK